MQGEQSERVSRDLELQLEQIAHRLAITEGEWTLQVRFRDGHYTELRRHHGPVRRQELDRLDRPTQPG